jgi:hypothetical protein
MRSTEQVYDQRSAACPQDRSIFVGLEVSRSSWLVAISMPGNQKISRYRMEAGDSAALLRLLRRLQGQAEQHCHGPVKIITIQEAGWTDFGYTVCWKPRALKVGWLMPPRLR